VLRQWLQEPHAITVAAFEIMAVFLGVALALILRSLPRNDPGLRAPATQLLALAAASGGLVGAIRLNNPWTFVAGGLACTGASALFLIADHRRSIRGPPGRIVSDRWQIVLKLAGFSWTRDKDSRHFFFSGDTGSSKTCGMNELLRRCSTAIPGSAVSSWPTRATSGFTWGGPRKNTTSRMT
jgi:hypothetical protein